MTQCNLAGRAAVVTGGASGIGLAVAERLAADGAAVLVGDIDGARGRIEAARLGARFVPCDLSTRYGCRALVDEALASFGALHILVNNAGYQHIAPVEEFSEDVWDNMLALMLTAPFLLTRYAWPSMVDAGWGRIVNMSSIHGLVASPYKAAYISAKHGLIGLTRTTALEGGSHGITVNAICPAYVRTPLVENQIAAQAKTRGLAPEEVVQNVMLEPAAVKRLIEPEEIAAFVAYLCTDAGAVITGAALPIDLGWTAR
jgi:3-hydroxybutyrate dehydrogenase